MRFLYAIAVVLLLVACGNKEQTSAPLTGDLEGEGHHIEDEATATGDDVRYALKNMEVALNQELLHNYPNSLFYVNLNGKLFYFTSKTPFKGDYFFGGEMKYGLLNDSSQLLLDMVYDKIANPDLTIVNCFEITKNGKVGLFNHVSKELLQPIFDFILPNGATVGEMAYGYAQGQWYQISNDDLAHPKKIALNPSTILKNLSFDVMQLGNRMMYSTSEAAVEEEGPGYIYGDGVVVYPSYISFFKFMKEDYRLGIMLPYQSKKADFGTSDFQLNAKNEMSISEKLTSFFIAIYEEGVEGRDYYYDHRHVVVYNEANQQLHAIALGVDYDRNPFCGDASYTFINDSIIEVKYSEVFGMERLYEIELKYKYFQVSSEGVIAELTSNRYFDFTQFVLIDENYFKGCFANSNPDGDNEKNMWSYDHLSIEDLDLMRNEIFATYGYIFETEKWQQYFSQKAWYKPLYKNVDSYLTEKDKANIQVILKVKKSMEGREESVINKKPATYVMAG